MIPRAHNRTHFDDGNVMKSHLENKHLGIGLLQIYNLPQIAMSNVFVSAGMVTTVAISVDRFLLLFWEYPKYLRILTRKRIMCIIGGIWLYGILLGTVELLLWDMLMSPSLHDYFGFIQDCRSPPKHNLVFALVVFIIGLFGPLLAIDSFSIAFFVWLIRKLHQPMVHPSSNIIMASQNADQSSNMSAAGPSSSSNVPMTHGAAIPRPEADPNKRYKKAAILLSAIVLAVNICTLPYVLYALITIFCPRCNNVYLRERLIHLVYLNSCINPFLYAANMIKIRSFYKRILCNSR
ncbi:melanocortin receptor 5-like [Amphiura filiformis]|uniref:melanocortin receptor 5-like n=1 Tax=Amphiura filiformis TaxID=82378 RepID=UPI003B220244